MLHCASFAHKVSIPERVLEALKLDGELVEHTVCDVSIPERVLEALKQSPFRRSSR